MSEQEKKRPSKASAGFIAGLLLAGGVIGGLLFVLNNNSGKTPPDPIEKTELPVPEVLTPKHEIQPTMLPEASAPIAAEDLPDDMAAKAEAAASQALAEHQAAVEQNSRIPTPENESTAPAGTAAAATGGTADSPAGNSTAPAAATPRQQAEKRPKYRQPSQAKKAPAAPKSKDGQPSPEQILSQGSVEKAREYEQQTAAQDQDRRQAEAALSGQSGRPAKAAAARSERKAVVQAGAYTSQDEAEAQRAKLAALGVNTSVAKAEVKGKTYYRVQTDEISRENAASVRSTLQRSGVETFTRPAQ